MPKLSIRLKIAGKSYSLSIDSEKEELYRRAEREVSTYVTRFERANFEGFSTADCLAMAALQLAFANVEAAASRRLGDGEAERLSALDSRLERYLESIE